MSDDDKREFRASVSDVCRVVLGYTAIGIAIYLLLLLVDLVSTTTPVILVASSLPAVVSVCWRQRSVHVSSESLRGGDGQIIAWSSIQRVHKIYLGLGFLVVESTTGERVSIPTSIRAHPRFRAAVSSYASTDNPLLLAVVPRSTGQVPKQPG
jgi:hypothetical protein